MNKMKYMILFLLAAFVAGPSMAQEYKVTVENTKEGELSLEGFPGNLPIEGYSGNEIIITSTAGRFEAPDRAKGLKPIYGGGTDNTGMAVAMEKNGNKISLHCLLPITQSADYRIKVPDNLVLKIHRDCERGGETNVQNIKNEIDFDGCDEIKLKNVTGPIVVSTINGEVNVVFSEISKDKPISIASVNGEVDVTIPAKSGVDVHMSTVNGNMYSDFDFAQDSKEMRRVGGSSIHGQLNGGGTDLKLSTVNANIYLRKG